MVVAFWACPEVSLKLLLKAYLTAKGAFYPKGFLPPPCPAPFPTMEKSHPDAPPDDSRGTATPRGYAPSPHCPFRTKSLIPTLDRSVDQTFPEIIGSNYLHPKAGPQHTLLARHMDPEDFLMKTKRPTIPFLPETAASLASQARPNMKPESDSQDALLPPLAEGALA